MERYWFISYVVNSYKWGTYNYHNNCISIHPIRWLIECNEKHAEKEHYTLIWATEITKEEYEKYNMEI